MNKYFKYILLTISLFFVGSMKVEAGLISGGKRVTCDYITPSGKKIYLATEDGGKTWYADTSVAGLGLKLNPFSLAKSELDVVDGLSTNGANCEEVQKSDIKENDVKMKYNNVVFTKDFVEKVNSISFGKKIVKDKMTQRIYKATGRSQ